MPETPASPASPPRAQTASFPPGQVTTPARIQCPEDRTREALRSIHIKENRTYKLYGDKYIAWFDEQLPDMKAKFKLKELHHRVSVIAVQYFFIEVVVPRKLTRKSALKYLYPLPKLSAREGSNIPLADMKTEAFLLQLQLIDTNCALRDKKNDDDGKGADGQEQMLSTEIMTQENLSKVLSTLLKSERKWECTAAEISTLSITLLRHDSILKVTLGKLYLTHLSPDGDTTPHDMKPYNCDLKSKFQGMPSQHLDPLNRFHFEEMSIADHFFSKWLVDSGNNLEIGEKLMKAYLTCHVLRNEACFHCNSKKSLRWNGNFRASWKDLVCLKCNVMYTVKTKASQKDVETAFRSNSFGHQMKIKNKMVPI